MSHAALQLAAFLVHQNYTLLIRTLHLWRNKRKSGAKLQATSFKFQPAEDP